MQRRCHHGTVIGIEAAQGLGQVITCHGDGACFWYAASHGGQPPSAWQPQQAAALKDRVLSLLRLHPEIVAAWLGASPEVAASITEDWKQWDSWADGRALALVSLLQNVTILIVNMTEQVLELYSPAETVDQVGETWALRFHKDHYDYINIDDIACLRAILFLLLLYHCTPDRDLTMAPLRGGASVAAPDSVHPASHLKAGSSSIAYNHVIDACDTGAICCRSLNVSGLRHHTDELMIHCMRDCMNLGLQETAVSRQAQRSLDSLFKQEGLAVVWGAPSPLTKTSSGAWRTDRKMPGVAFVHSSDLPLFPVQMRTPRARVWAEPRTGKTSDGCAPL